LWAVGKMSTFHIHVDAASIVPEFEEYLIETGFVRTDFAGHPEGADGFEAPNHLTLKLNDSVEFRKRFDELESRARATSGIKGYLEGEFIPLDEDVADRPRRDGFNIPFRVTSHPIGQGTFRETEIHITLDRDRSDPRLLASLSEMGFFSAYMNKSYGVAQIFTVQGSRSQIDQILPRLLNFLETSGGTARCSVKEERVARWWLSEPSVALPPVIDEIEWLQT
jgi:hypothetical protein